MKPLASMHSTSISHFYLIRLIFPLSLLVSRYNSRDPKFFYFKYINYFNGLDMEAGRRAKKVRAMTRLAKRTGTRHGTP